MSEIDEIRIIGLPSPLDIGEAVKNMALRKIRNDKEFATLPFITNKTPDEVILAGVKELLESEEYKFSEEIMSSQRWVVQIHELRIGTIQKCTSEDKSNLPTGCRCSHISH